MQISIFIYDNYLFFFCRVGTWAHYNWGGPALSRTSSTFSGSTKQKVLCHVEDDQERDEICGHRREKGLISPANNSYRLRNLQAILSRFLIVLLSNNTVAYLTNRKYYHAFYTFQFISFFSLHTNKDFVDLLNLWLFDASLNTQTLAR